MFKGVCAVTHNFLFSAFNLHINKSLKTLLINQLEDNKYATTLILINKNSGNKFILWR